MHQSDRGVQQLSIRYTDKMTTFGVSASVGTTGDSYDNVLAETVNWLYKSEVIEYLKKNWTGVNDVELATLKQVALRAQLSSCEAKSIVNAYQV